MNTLSGVWLPIMTPFHDGAVDFVSYGKLIELRPTQRPTRCTPPGQLPMSAVRAYIGERRQSVISPGRCDKPMEGSVNLPGQSE
jgi:hypothetical protein